MIEVAFHLDPHQQAFCTAHAKTDIRLLAPAGCGKTLCLLARCDYLSRDFARSRKNPPRFLLVTFTRGATTEIRDRISDRSLFPHLTSLAGKHPADVDRRSHLERVGISPHPQTNLRPAIAYNRE